MPKLLDATPQISVHLYKTISRKTVDGQSAVSARYEGKEEFIDLTPFLNDGAAVRTSKSVREPAGVFSITFADRPHDSVLGAFASMSPTALESIYGLVEPMDMIEIRMWSGIGPRPPKLPIKMRGFVTDVQRNQTMGQDGRPQRQVVVNGYDYGLIWQIIRVLGWEAYTRGIPLLTSIAFGELFGGTATNVMRAGQFVRTVFQKVINPFITNFMPEHSPMPKEIQTGSSISVAHGVVNLAYLQTQGQSIYDILKLHGDVGVWNELYTEDREDGVHVVYRPIPALHLTAPSGSSSRKIQDDAPDPVIVDIPDSQIRGISAARTVQQVANFYWVNNSRFDLIDDIQRRAASITMNTPSVLLRDHQNADPKLYGLRPMYAETQQGGDDVTSMTSGMEAWEHERRSKQIEAWIDKRRRLLLEMNRDNVVFERGSASIKGGPMRADSTVEAMKAGDYANFQVGNIEWLAYVVQIEDEFLPFQSYTTSVIYERGEGFVTRARMEGGVQSPWLAEQATRRP